MLLFQACPDQKLSLSRSETVQIRVVHCTGHLLHGLAVSTLPTLPAHCTELFPSLSRAISQLNYASVKELCMEAFVSD